MRVLRRERSNRSASKCCAMTASTERCAKIARETAHIEAFACAHRNTHRRPRIVEDCDLMHDDRAWRQLNRRVVARKLIRALSINMNGAKRRRTLQDRAKECSDRRIDLRA